MKPQRVCIIIPFVISVLAVSSAVSVRAQPQAKLARVSGQVKGTYGDMKRFARVQLDGPESYIAITDSTGRFSFQEVIQGRYKITVTQGNNVQIFSQTVSTGTLDLMVNW